MFCILELLLSLLSKKSAVFDTPSALVLQNTDLSAAGSTDAFLSSKLRFVKDAHGQDICEVDADGETVGVMMGWERGISEHAPKTMMCRTCSTSQVQATVERVCSDHPELQSGLKVLNVGFGLGIVSSSLPLADPPNVDV